MSVAGVITGIVIAGGLIAFSFIGGGYLDRVDDAFDDATDADSRTAAFANELRGEVPSGNRLGRGGQGRSAGHLGSLAHTQTRPLIAPPEQGR